MYCRLDSLRCRCSALTCLSIMSEVWAARYSCMYYVFTSPSCFVACVNVSPQLRRSIRLSRAQAKDMLTAFAAADSDRNGVLYLKELSTMTHPVDGLHMRLVMSMSKSSLHVVFMPRLLPLMQATVPVTRRMCVGYTGDPLLCDAGGPRSLRRAVQRLLHRCCRHQRLGTDYISVHMAWCSHHRFQATFVRKVGVIVWLHR